jgi:hypothetical protein
MTPAKKKASAKSKGKLKDLSVKRSPKGGSAAGGSGGGKAIEVDGASPKFGWIQI